MDGRFPASGADLGPLGHRDTAAVIRLTANVRRYEQTLALKSDTWSSEPFYPLLISPAWFAQAPPPGAADVVAALPTLQHVLAGLQGCSRAEQDLLELHLRKE